MTDTLDRDALTFTFERRLRVPREVVFDAWTTPQQITKWWDPSGEPLVACSADLRVGGAFRFENAGHSPPFSGVYTVVDRPARLGFEALGAAGTVTLDSDGAVTRMRVTITCGSREHFETFVKLGVDQGTRRTMDNLVALLHAPLDDVKRAAS